MPISFLCHCQEHLIKAAEEEAGHARQHAETYKGSSKDYDAVKAELDDMSRRISTIETERDDYLKRMMELEQSQSDSDVRHAKVHMLKVRQSH